MYYVENEYKENTIRKVFKILLLLIFLIIFFLLGIFFEKWGGVQRLAPNIINFIRNNFLGDKTVLELEKKYFDYIDKKNKKNINFQFDNTADNSTDTPINQYVINIAKSYIENPLLIQDKDYSILKILTDNYIENIPPLYEKEILNEGIWEKFEISPSTFKPLYAKTFLRTDLERPYAIVYIYRFDMDRLNLEFIPGSEDSQKRDGKITEDQKNRVMWIFSGGFQYKHGKYGMKHNGEILLPPINGAATLFCYKDGRLEIKEWKEDTSDDESILWFRQNELPLIIDGKITDKINRMWGLTPLDVHPIYTVRSGIGLTKDNDIVFAFGESLSAATLALGMIKAGVINGMHLDMNYFNVHFVRAVKNKYGRLETFNENDKLSFYKNIYTVTSARDYFILTKKDRSE
ncbi:MAG TPA: hypothetical protein PLE45_04375 [Spirochaetota bacterium]|nr:hypothetical protein [Spirochaetota bacterium]HOL56473.1 hypothetical protein [Spirochaetota bacterium]HPP03396.1 hypothetical protein [Spirochaetota bacterium]